MQELKVLPVERIDAPSPDRFLSEYVRPGRPVVLRGLMDEWPARHWTLDQLALDFGGAMVPVAPVRDGVVQADARRGVVRHPMRLGAYLGSLRAGSNPGYLTARSEELPPDLRRAVLLPEYCRGAPWQVMKLWLSSPGTVSAMHFDLADNLHTQVFGSKRFTLAHPRERACVYPNGWLSGIPNGCRVDIEHPDRTRFPLLGGVNLCGAELECGETLYIPRRWWHHVRTVRLSCSVNHWWARGAWGAVVKVGDLLKQARGISR
jgi:hypothetical protein